MLIGQDDADRHGLDDVAVARLACPQRLLHVLAVGHVHEGRRRGRAVRPRSPVTTVAERCTMRRVPLRHSATCSPAHVPFWRSDASISVACSVSSTKSANWRPEDFFAAFVPPKAQKGRVDVGDMALEVRDHRRAERRGNHGFLDAQLFRCVAVGIGLGGQRRIIVGPCRHRRNSPARHWAATAVRQAERGCCL